jgi:hypothetical protein
MKRKPILIGTGLMMALVFLGLFYWFRYWYKVRPVQIKKYCQEYANQEFQNKFGQPYFDPGPPYSSGQNSLYWSSNYHSCLKQKGLE